MELNSCITYHIIIPLANPYYNNATHLCLTIGKFTTLLQTSRLVQYAHDSLSHVSDSSGHQKNNSAHD